MRDIPTILVIDDDMIILTVIGGILKKLYNVHTVSSAYKAFDYLEKNNVDVIILDNQMPGMSGMEALQKLKSNPLWKNIPVVFHTADDHNDSEIEALKIGAADYLIKPVNATILQVKVAQQLELYNYRNKLEMMVMEKTEDLEKANELLKERDATMTTLLATVTDMRDGNTGEHLTAIAKFSRLIVDCLVAENPLDVPKGYWLSQSEADSIVDMSKLHDIGKIGIPDNILLKPGKLTPEEFEVIKQHPLFAKKILDDYKGDKTADFLNMAKDICYTHHEKWNGSGYPRGLKGEEIPLSGRIVAIVDVYDALTSVRPYKSAYSHEQAVDIIRSDRGQHFDPYLVDLFLQHEQTFAKLKAEIIADTSTMSTYSEKLTG